MVIMPFRTVALFERSIELPQSQLGRLRGRQASASSPHVSTFDKLQYPGVGVQHLHRCWNLCDPSGNPRYLRGLMVEMLGKFTELVSTGFAAIFNKTP